MLNSKHPELVETVFNANQRGEAEGHNALTLEAARRAALLKNIERLRALRLARDQMRSDEGKSSKRASAARSRRGHELRPSLDSKGVNTQLPSSDGLAHASRK
jgi:hypothetical protein